MTPIVRPLGDDDREWVRGFIRDRWGDETVVGHGVVYRPATLPGLILIDDSGDPAGLLTYMIEADACEIVTIDSVVEGRGYGSGLLDEVSRVAREAGCSRLWLITTNDNERAIGFYLPTGSTSWRSAKARSRPHGSSSPPSLSSMTAACR